MMAGFQLTRIAACGTVMFAFFLAPLQLEYPKPCSSGVQHDGTTASMLERPERTLELALLQLACPPSAVE